MSLRLCPNRTSRRMRGARFDTYQRTVDADPEQVALARE
jgi:hypothetical protein